MKKLKYEIEKVLNMMILVIYQDWFLYIDLIFLNILKIIFLLKLK